LSLVVGYYGHNTQGYVIAGFFCAVAAGDFSMALGQRRLHTGEAKNIVEYRGKRTIQEKRKESIG